MDVSIEKHIEEKGTGTGNMVCLIWESESLQKMFDNRCTPWEYQVEIFTDPFKLSRNNKCKNYGIFSINYQLTKILDFKI